MVEVYQYGRLQSVTRKNNAGAQIASISYGYNRYGLRVTATDARNGTTYYSYNNADLVQSVTSPAAGDGTPPQVTAYYYDNMLRLTDTVEPNGSTVSKEYYVTGDLKRQSGALAYPVSYAYDVQGRMTNMTTWQNAALGTGAASTSWSYDSARGWLTSKHYADNSSVSYTYTAGGRLRTRVGGRGVTTTYNTNVFGDVVSVSYSDTTPAVTITYDRLGRKLSMSSSTESRAFAYSLDGRLLSETNLTGPLVGYSVSNNVNSLWQHAYLYVRSSAGVISTHVFTYDGASRLASVAQGNYNIAYGYAPNSSLVDSMTFKSNTTVRLTTAKAYDHLNRLVSSVSTPSGASAISYQYQYNRLNQRTKAIEADGSYWLYQYDELGQVTSGKKRWLDETPVAGQQFEYDFDDIGNRISTKVGGDNDGWNLRPANYTVTALNQYTNRTVSGTVDVIGIADARAAVTVNNQTAERKVEYYHLGLALSNSTALYPSITNKATYGTTSTTTGHVFIPATPEYFNHDADGNLTSDGRWKYTWDAENRLTAMESITNGTPSASWRKLAFVYDAQGRRIRKTVQIGNTNATWGAVIFDNLYVYNGWNLMVELNATNKAIINSYMWGADVSGTEQGAGGVGGLLKIYRPGAADNFTVYDANGNLTALVDGSYGTVSANYEYGPFGELIRATGPMAKANPFRFSSTKYQDDETDLVMYPARPYNPSTGRWLTKDPLGEKAG